MDDLKNINVFVQPLCDKNELECAHIMTRAMRQAFFWTQIADVDLKSFRAFTEDEIVIVASIENQTVGFASIYEPNKFLHHLYVDPDFQRKGIGSALLTETYKIIGQNISLKCQVKNKLAREFYRANGWIEDLDVGGKCELGEWLWIRKTENK